MNNIGIQGLHRNKVERIERSVIDELKLNEEDSHSAS